MEVDGYLGHRLPDPLPPAHAAARHHLLHRSEYKHFAIGERLTYSSGFTWQPHPKVVWFVLAFALVGCIPNQRLRRLVNDTVSLIGFRIVARSLSAVITFHNEEYKPKNCGFCVANHTSPIDVTMLATDCTYSLVSLGRCSRFCTQFGGVLKTVQCALNGAKNILTKTCVDVTHYGFTKCLHVSLLLHFHPSACRSKNLGLLAYILHSFGRLHTG